MQEEKNKITHKTAQLEEKCVRYLNERGTIDKHLTTTIVPSSQKND